MQLVRSQIRTKAMGWQLCSQSGVATAKRGGANSCASRLAKSQELVFFVGCRISFEGFHTTQYPMVYSLLSCRLFFFGVQGSMFVDNSGTPLLASRAKPNQVRVIIL